jgi:hypothetical protein
MALDRDQWLMDLSSGPKLVVVSYLSKKKKKSCGELKMLAGIQERLNFLFSGLAFFSIDFIRFIALRNDIHGSETKLRIMKW